MNCFRWLPLIFVAALAPGCAALNLQKPSAAVTAMAVQDVNPQGFTMKFEVNVTNPNNIALPWSAGDYNVGVGGVKLVDGTVKPEGSSLPAKGSQVVTVPVAVTFESLLLAENAIRTGNGKIPYDLVGG